MGRLTSTLVAAILSLVVMLATIGATFPTKTAVSRQIELESPYAKDRSLILYRLGQIEQKLDQLLNQR